MSPLARVLALAYLKGRLDATQRFIDTTANAERNQEDVSLASVLQHNHRDILRDMQTKEQDT